MTGVSLETELFGERLALPVALAPVGLTGMYARRGEVQAARAAAAKGVPFTLSTVSVCPIEEVAAAIDRPMWFQLYVLRDRGFMRNALERAWAAGVRTLVFTVDMPTPGARYRDAHSGMSGPRAGWRRMLQAVGHPRWAWDVGLRGRPHDLGNLSPRIAAILRGWPITSAGSPTISIIRFRGRTCNGSASLGRARWSSRASSIRRMRAARCASARMESWCPIMAAASSMACRLRRVRCRLLPRRYKAICEFSRTQAFAVAWTCCGCWRWGRMRCCSGARSCTRWRRPVRPAWPICWT